MVAGSNIQTSFSELQYVAKKKVKRGDLFLSQIDALAPLTDLLSALVSLYPKSDRRGRPFMELEQYFGLSDDGVWPRQAAIDAYSQQAA